MKAAVLYKLGEAPKYADFKDPVALNDDMVLIDVKASAVKNLDKGKASGAHYSASSMQEPEVVGMDGVGVTADGRRVYGMGSGMIAEKALLNKNRMVDVPNNLGDVEAAALPNAIFGAASALRFRAGIQVGDVVLINGATGVTGMVAVQVAKYFGASKVIVTGRNDEALQQLLSLGADETISLKQDDGTIVDRIKTLHAATPIDIVIDYIWGHSAELILSALQGKGMVTHKVRYITVGGMAGDKISLSSAWLRSSDIQIMGSGLGSLPKEAINQFFSDLLPEMLQLAADGKLKIKTTTLALKDIETAWTLDIPAGTRLVIMV